MILVKMRKLKKGGDLKKTSHLESRDFTREIIIEHQQLGSCQGSLCRNCGLEVEVVF